ncbi:RES family NAD+ phosphorylase [Spirosoma fluviale]|uniref:RES domain-containing protein n=1 Tax=Spirosoma fluviale TaxID=1597977 RepID=A0A286FCU9_9BACT|nr:RES family NAD+ phosphorylase [Spirosoma fluviale]SOD80926.1 RES domain-containing protein [Spirosoma fluviale]
MAICYRIQKSKHNSGTLSGIGASITGGRWNPVGTPMVYTSTTVSLCVLEILVHTDKSLLPNFPPHSLIKLEIPDECIREFHPDELLPGWTSIPPTDVSRFFLMPYLTTNSSLAFKVPSAVNPYEYNILLNPEHPDIGKVIEYPPIAFKFDQRFM